MAGRGRGATLPAWMTQGGLTASDNGVQSSVAAPIPLVPKPAPVTQSFVPPSAPPSFVPPASAPSFSRPPSFPPPQNPNPIPVSAPPSFAPMNHHNNGFPSGMGNFPPPMMTPGFPMPMHGFAPPPSFPPSMGYGGIPPPSFPPMARPAAPAIDPVNDVSCWTEHESEEGVKYWFNSVTQQSTYEKPMCLKTPEERAIQPCQWKEYTSPDGKKYYSNGTESIWTMPEEFRIWKEQMDAIEEKKKRAVVDAKVAKQAARQGSSANLSSSTSNGNAPATSSDAHPSSSSNGHNGSVAAGAAVNAAVVAPAIVYASVADAMEAFKELLGDKQISAIAKMKEVQDACQSDPRWEALKSQGEKKQALAEYQTRRLKLEKDVQKARARKQRDAFLLMLAENTDIDARTRWRDAQLILQEDARYKNIEDPRDREDLFQEFVAELEKKEKEDKRRLRDTALVQFEKLLREYSSEGKIDRRSIWAEVKKVFMDVITRPEFRALDDTDYRRSFQAHIQELEEDYRSVERKRREEVEETIATRMVEFRSFLEEASRNGQIGPESRWKDFSKLEKVEKCASLNALKELYEQHPNPSLFQTEVRGAFERVVAAVGEQCRLDKKVLKSGLSTHRVEVKGSSSSSSRDKTESWRVEHDTNEAEFWSVVCKVAGVKVSSQTPPTDYPCPLFQADEGAGSRSATPMPVDGEDGEEKDDSRLPQNQLKALLLERPHSVFFLFQDSLSKAKLDYEEEQAYVRKLEKKFVALLDDAYYKREHLSITWDEAKKSLQRRSVYEELSKTERRRLYCQFMIDLARKHDQAIPEHINDLQRELDNKDTSTGVEKNDRASSRAEENAPPRDTRRSVSRQRERSSARHRTDDDDHSRKRLKQ